MSPSSIPSDVFENRAALDQALFVILERWVTKGLKSSERDEKRWVELYIERATQLPSISESQRDALRELRADAAFHEGERLMEQIEVLHKEALAAFERASASDSRYKERARLRLNELLGQKGKLPTAEAAAGQEAPPPSQEAAAADSAPKAARASSGGNASSVETQSPTP